MIKSIPAMTISSYLHIFTSNISGTISFNVCYFFHDNSDLAAISSSLGDYVELGFSRHQCFIWFLYSEMSNITEEHFSLLIEHVLGT